MAIEINYYGVKDVKIGDDVKLPLIGVHGGMEFNQVGYSGIISKGHASLNHPIKELVSPPAKKIKRLESVKQIGVIDINNNNLRVLIIRNCAFANSSKNTRFAVSFHKTLVNKKRRIKPYIQ